MKFQKGHEAIGGFETRFKKGDGLGKHHSDEVKLKQSETKLGDKNPNWNGGIKIMRGYVAILKPEHPYNNGGYVLEHRLIMEDFLGRYLLKGEEIHHINGIKNDNRLENLMLFANKGKHTFFHHEQDRLAMAVSK